MPSFTLQRSRILNGVTISSGSQSLHLEDLKVLANLSTGLSCRHIERYRHGNVIHRLSQQNTCCPDSSSVIWR